MRGDLVPRFRSRNRVRIGSDPSHEDLPLRDGSAALRQGRERAETCRYRRAASISRVRSGSVRLQCDGYDFCPFKSRITRSHWRSASSWLDNAHCFLYRGTTMATDRRQATFRFCTWGGRRRGAGRKRAGTRAGVPHRRREGFHRSHPVHVTLRAERALPSLRGPTLFAALRSGLAAASTNVFRVVHFSVQGNHVHLLIEADGTQALARGMQGLGIRLAKAINRRLGRTGRVWADRYHGRALGTPREVRHALVYVLLNGRKHRVSGRGVDVCSSGAWFDGWGPSVEAAAGPAPVARPQTWLLRIGWRRNGSIDINDAPAGART
jgi:REP element-mobilizing transposase RayT